MATTDLHRALSQIQAIRGHIARGSEFRGYGPATVTVTAALAWLAAMLQSAWIADPQRDIAGYLLIWVGTAALSVIVTGIEAIARARRLHSVLAFPMLHAAAEQFAPAIVAGLMLTVVLVRSAPGDVWMLPGLWQVVFSLGVFASCRFLPRATFLIGLWYLGCGLLCLALGPGRNALSPWAMALPFGVGQLLVGAVLHFDSRYQDD